MRFSASHQGRGSTLDRQQYLIDQWLSSHPTVKKSNLSATDKGKSGFKGDHLKHGLGNILNAIDQGRIQKGDYILVEAMDRIGRLEPLDMVTLIQKIVAKGVIIVTLEDRNEYTLNSLNDSLGSLFILVGKVQQAHEYSKNLSRRITAAYEKKRSNARQGLPINLNTPFWLNSSGRLIPENAEIVRKCINLYLKGYGTRKAILSLIDEYPKIRSVHPTTLKRWFTNRSLIGDWSNKGDPIPDVFEPLVEPSVFYQLQNELKRRTKNMSPEETYDLSGLVVCDNCGSRFHFRRKKHSDYVIVYANCSTYLKRGAAFCDNNKTWPYEVLHAIYESTYWEKLSNLASNQYSNKEEEKLSTLQAQLKEVNERIDQLLEILISLPNQQNTKDKILIQDETKSTLEKKISSIERYLSSDENYDLGINPERLNDLYDELDADPIYRRDILKKAGYQLKARKDQISVDAGPAGSETFTLVKRSTKHKCYFVEAYTPSHTLIEVSSEEYVNEPSISLKLAINREGVICQDTVETWDELCKLYL